jgi:dTDP-4-amino-4,6-dideoxygalactose transaminase
MITTNDERMYKDLIMLRTHGITKDPSLLSESQGGWYYEMQSLGFNYRLTDIQAALGASQLVRANSGLARRRAIADFYDRAFAGTPVMPLGLDEREGHAFHLYVVQVEGRKEVYDHLRAHGIFAQVHYIPVHTLPYYQELGHRTGDHPASEAFYQTCLSIPMYPSLRDDEAQYVVDTLLEYLKS